MSALGISAGCLFRVAAAAFFFLAFLPQFTRRSSHWGCDWSGESGAEPEQAGSPSFGSRPARVGGGRGIRTPDTLSGTAVFKTAAINHSAIPPHGIP